MRLEWFLCVQGVKKGKAELRWVLRKGGSRDSNRENWLILGGM